MTVSMIDVTELEKEYAFDMMKIGTPDWKGVPYLLKIDSSYYDFAKKRGQLKSITDAVKIFKNLDCTIYTIYQDPNSEIIKSFLISEGVDSIRITDY